MDSAVRAGILAVCEHRFGNDRRVYTPAYVLPSGNMIRHPDQYPATNDRNFTRDQMSCLIAGLHHQRYVAFLRDIFVKTKSRWFFAQNIDRDILNSNKILWPHEFYKDSNPYRNTYPMKWSWKEWKFKSTIPQLPGVEIEKRTVDGRDPLTPSVVGALIKACDFWWGKPFVLFGRAWLELELFQAQRKDQSSTELNQLFCICTIYGDTALRQFKQIPGMEASFRNYWGSKNELEYSDMILKYLEKVG